MEFIDRRKSVRRFAETAVPREALLEMVRAATRAPSGQNCQNWHFVVVAGHEQVEAVARVVAEKTGRLADASPDAEAGRRMRASIPSRIFFRHAPALILVYAADYPSGLVQELRDVGAPEDLIQDYRRICPAIQSIGAAIENLLLAAAAMGYGGCWINSAVRVAGREIGDAVGFHKEGYYLAAMTPIGIPADHSTAPSPRKTIENVVTFVGDAGGSRDA